MESGSSGSFHESWLTDVLSTFLLPREKLGAGGVCPLTLCWARRRISGAITASIPHHHLCSHWYQSIRLCWVTLTLQDRLDRSQSYGKPSKKLEHWMCGLPLFFPMESEFLYFLTHCWVGYEGYETMMTASPHHCHSFHWPQEARLCWVLSTLWNRLDRIQSFG